MLFLLFLQLLSSLNSTNKPYLYCVKKEDMIFLMKLTPEIEFDEFSYPGPGQSLPELEMQSFSRTFSLKSCLIISINSLSQMTFQSFLIFNFIFLNWPYTSGVQPHFLRRQILHNCGDIFAVS